MRPRNLKPPWARGKLEARIWTLASVFATSKTPETARVRLKAGCKRRVLGGLATDLKTQQGEQGLDQVHGSVGERLGHHCREIVVEASPGQAKKARAKCMNG